MSTLSHSFVWWVKELPNSLTGFLSTSFQYEVFSKSGLGRLLELFIIITRVLEAKETKREEMEGHKESTGGRWEVEGVSQVCKGVLRFFFMICTSIRIYCTIKHPHLHLVDIILSTQIQNLHKMVRFNHLFLLLRICTVMN